jgi:regulator of protease activity HflC (stomatin/prohibitin superfamily)
LVGWLGLVLCVVGGLILAILAIASESTSSVVWVAAFQTFGAAGIWLLTLIQLHQKRLVAEERLEVAELERQRKEKLGGAETIFDEEDLGQMERLAMGRRLRSIERFLVPTIALLIAAYHLIAGISIMPWRWQFPPIADAGGGPILEPMRLAVFCGAIAFVCFMYSRYALGMSRLKDWGLISAGGNFTFGSSAVCLAACISLLFASNGVERVEIWVARGVAILLMILACETVINFILDFYRPRVPGQRQMPFYDSRLLGMFSEPGDILQSVADKIDYQFGFKVSETWFYKLLGQKLPLLLLFQILVILALTCIVVVPPGHQAVIERWGRPQAETAKPGIHLTWLWPVDRATVIPVQRIRRLELGHEEEDRKKEEEETLGMPVLWTKQHYKKEYKLLVADRAASADTKVPVNLLSVNMPVQWRVKPADQQVIRFHRQSEDVSEIIESISYRELTRYAAQTDILDLLGEGGIEASATLQKRIQAACDSTGHDGRGLGVEIVYVGIGGVHPPADDEVAKAYEDVVGAIEKREAKIKQAQGDAAEIRVASAGTGWERLYEAIVREDQARASDSAELGRCTAEVARILRTETGGRAREMAARAEMRALGRVFGEKSAAERYAIQLAAYRVAPYTYLLRLYLRMVAEGLEDVRKYVIVLNDSDRVIYVMDLKPPQAIDLLGAELSAQEAAEGQ